MVAAPAEAAALQKVGVQRTEVVGLEGGEAESADAGKHVGLQHPAEVAGRRAGPGDAEALEPALQIFGQRLAAGLGDRAALGPADKFG